MAGVDRGAHADSRREVKGLCGQEYQRPRASVVVRTEGGPHPVLSTARRGPPPHVGRFGRCPGCWVTSSLLLRV